MGSQPTAARYQLEWCETCYEHNQRTFKDKHASEQRYYDEMRTITGNKSRYSLK